MRRNVDWGKERGIKRRRGGKVEYGGEEKSALPDRKGQRRREHSFPSLSSFPIHRDDGDNLLIFIASSNPVHEGPTQECPKKCKSVQGKDRYSNLRI